MEAQYHHGPGGGQSNSRTNGSRRKNTKNRRQETQVIENNDMHINKSGEVQREDIMHSLANDEALLNDFLLFRQRQHLNSLAPQVSGQREPYEGQCIVFND
ncbi:unnamed protein product [Rotaria sp. Silwood1]|nr:unnamed protein product [Rotaria sp. Silwood1]CAF3745613.1 unnamed protein product [Rotaria sp. Silwood1]CAF3857020.1 unnamed protein product [Rotaria sp. Silwood1]CAF4941879.1 unnamed protein product [Rotaria sp. Silwood1]CAF4973005.1 unnamed protein product [Rotaria sp. Silwood1]